MLHALCEVNHIHVVLVPGCAIVNVSKRSGVLSRHDILDTSMSLCRNLLLRVATSRVSLFPRATISDFAPSIFYCPPLALRLRFTVDSCR